MEWTFSLDAVEETAAAFIRAAGKARVFAFHGPMGAGKTTFIHALCTAYGVSSTVSSPTFSIINEYRYPVNGKELPLYHMDLYRLRDEEEAQRAGVEDAVRVVPDRVCSRVPVLRDGAVGFVSQPDGRRNRRAGGGGPA